MFCVLCFKGVNKLDINDIIKTSLEHINSKYWNRFTHKRIVNGFRRFDASRGMEYVVDLLLADQHTSRDCVKRVHLVRPTGNAEIVPMPHLNETRQVTIVLPIFPEEWNMVTQFVDKFVANCLAVGDDSQLLVVFVEQSAGKQIGSKQHTGDAYRKMNSTLMGYQSKYKAQKTIKWMRVTVGSLYRASFAVMDAVSARLQSDSLVVVGSVGMSVAVEYLNRVRLNTIIGQQVFFPIGYWSFKPNLVSDHPPSKSAKIPLNSKSGHYDKDQYSHSSFYISDYLFARNQMRDAVRATLKDTRELFDMFLNFHTLHVLRAIEPELRLQYRPVRCTGSSRDPIEADCWRSRSHALARGPQLAMLILQHQDKL